MSREEMRKIRDALIIFWASAKTDYTRSLEERGKDNYLTEGFKRDYKASLEALSIAEKELDGEVWGNTKKELEVLYDA